MIPKTKNNGETNWAFLPAASVAVVRIAPCTSWPTEPVADAVIDAAVDDESDTFGEAGACDNFSWDHV